MSSWSSAYPPPPPRGRSRSRSPYRGGGYPPRSSYPEGSYPQDPYRADWEAYDRDRAWANYERERAAYEYGRRPRSRSPPGGEGGRKRQRSLSPWERDRYEPRPRYNDDYDAHSRGYGHDRGGQYPPPPPYGSNRRAPPDPHTFDYPATLKQYAEWFRYYYPQQAMEEDNADKAAEQEAGDGSKPRNGIRSRWEKYKKDFAAQQLQRMFEHHRKSPWFSEKYDPAPEFQGMRTRVRKFGWRGRMDVFISELESGNFDPDFTEHAPETSSPTKENVNGEATSANGASADAGVVEETKPAVPASGEEDMQFNVEAEEDAGDNDANRAGDKNRRPVANRGEEIAVPPEGNQIMIRTIPPDIGRAKLEESIRKFPGFIYLALGDPLQKRNYYRAGWIKFGDDADMPSIMAELSEKKIEGFKLHVSHITKPFVTRVRYTPEVASKPDRLAKDLENAKKLAALLEGEYMRLRKAKVDEKPQDNGEPSANANGDKPEAPAEDATMADATADADDPEPREMGSEAVERRVEKVLADLHEQGAVDTSDEKSLEAKRTVIALDLYLAYLRAAFNTCYYCAVVTDHVEELQRKCVKHVRKPLSKMLLQEVQAEAQKAEKDPKAEEGTEVAKERDVTIRERPTENRDWKRNDERWLEWLDSKVALLINRDGVDPRDYGGKSYEEELSRACEAHIKQEDEGKFRCKTCQKLFKATSFVEKHIANKHADLIKQLDEIPFFNNFALDPHRIQPFAHPPQPVGSSQPPPPQAYGLQGPAYATDFARPPPYHAYTGYPPHPGYWDPYAYQQQQYGGGQYPPPPPRRDESVSGRRLSDRISGLAPGFDQPLETPLVPASAGLPAKPAVSMDLGLGARRGRGGPGGPSPPPPPDVKEDPRAQAGKKVSYIDVDRVAEGDVELTY
ncbi:Serrate RNA effector molecule -like protein [Trametes pubescens]|uniref:Serrate RNA effector molecule-like protein n=1 Tax=Trametes pubescens TaxID=154538 RepID=A0A1M2W0J0_TRAPU|nr:Serrate RNA effector molecule -like protein [Trametes pubescens]